ncbi:hypothetical protein MMC17_004293 [Xylographa soralifera]|nr:hypothetical protein [Xylographa soralifera]
MPSLTDIPPEVRSQIIELVLCSSRAPPSDPATTSQNRIELHDLKYVSWQYGQENNMYEPDGYITNSLSLLLTNRQLWAETQSALRCLPTKHSYSLDVMFVNERELWPTWLSVPALWTRLDNVFTTFRICGSKGQGPSELRGGNGGPPQIIWCFYSLMERFLTYGPVGERKPGSQDRNITINSLTLDIVSSPENEVTMTELAPTYMDWYRSRHGHADNDLSSTPMRAEWLADFLHGFIPGLLRMGYHTAPYGMIMYERIGTLRLCVDGVLKQKYDLCKMLADLQYNDASETFGNIWPRENRVPFFREWKKKALVKRREAGLPVIDPEDSDLL